MDWLDFTWHVAGFVAPALVLAPAMVLASRFLGTRGQGACLACPSSYQFHGLPGGGRPV
jgi:hypothetical protein